MTQRTEGVPGITDKDAEWLFEYIYSQKKVAARTKKVTAFQGFISLLYVLWCRLTRATKNKRVAIHLRDLFCRFGLVSHGHESNEDVPTFAVIDRLERFPGPEYESDRCAPDDYTDMRNIMDAYVKRVAPMPQNQPPPLNSCNKLLRWATLGLGKSVEPTWHMLLTVVEASTPRLWLALEDLAEPGSLHRAVRASSVTETFIHVRPYMQDRRVKNEDKIRLVHIIIEGDWVNLLGRVLLFGALDGPSTDNRDILEAFDGMAYDWLKVYEHKNVLQGTHLRRDDSYWQYLFQSEVEWVQAGKILGFTRRLDRERGRRVGYGSLGVKK
ncbi:hypothetical protein FRC06_009178, partial [Ceratobasidium sp. 370]